MPKQTAVLAGEETRAIPMITRDLSIRSDTFSVENNTVDVTFTTGARGTRFMWSSWQTVDEELATEPVNVRLDRLNTGGPVLNTHQSYELDNQIGSVVPGSARMEGGVGVATLQLSRREDIAPIVADIRDGIIRNVSVGYVVHTYEITENDGSRPLYRATDWEPYEISFVPMPFDIGAQVRSGEAVQGGNPCVMRRAIPAVQENNMPTAKQAAGNDPAAETRSAEPAVVVPPVVAPDAAAAPAAESRAAPPAAVTVPAIRTAVRNAGLGDDVAFEIIERHAEAPLTNDALMADIGRRFANRDTPASTVNRVSITRDAGDTARAALSDAIFLRMVPGELNLTARGTRSQAEILAGASTERDLRERAAPFRHMTLLRMAEEHLRAAGVSVNGMSHAEIAERALHTTSDFANLTGSGLNRRLRMAYEENHPSYRRWARRAPNTPDFRSIDVIQMSAMPDLLQTNEAGEFKYGTASDGKASYSLLTYGRIIGLSRQLLINDDLRALDRIAVGFAGAAARLENRTVYSALTANAAMADTIALFHASHANLAGSGAAISATTLGAGRTAMRLQKGLQSEELNLAPAFLIVPATQEQLAYQYTSTQFVPTKTTDINEFRLGGRTAVEPIVEAVLDGTSTTNWYLAASDAQVDTVEYTYLDGAEGVQISNRLGFTVDGVELKASLDFAAAVIDYRGLYSNPGA